MSKIINKDGSVQGETFTKVPGIEYPYPQSGEETYADYHDRVEKLREQGFHLGDLGWSDYQTYCMGSGYYEGVDSGWIIGRKY
jgi:hypothetical protein